LKGCKHINKGVALTAKAEPETSKLFEKITSYKNLEWAYEKTLKNGGRHASEAVKYKSFEVSNLRTLRKDLLEGRYEFGTYRRKIVYEPKQRVVDVPQIQDKIVQHAVHNVIKDIFFKSFIHDSYACIDGKGTHKATTRLHHFLRKAAWQFGDKATIIKIDIERFFYSIDRSLLKKELPKRIKCTKTLKLIERIIDSARQISERGIPLGNPLSHILANVAMNPLDQYAKRKLGLKYYLRYADDIFIITKDLDEARRTLAELETFIKERLNLKCNEKKTKIFPVNQGVNALGFKIHKTHMLLRDRSKRNIKRKTKKMQHLVRDNRMPKEKAEQILNSWYGHASYASSENFVDRLIKRNDYIYKEGKTLKVDIQKASESHDLQVKRQIRDVPV
jgi:retron-type reverse transcriptase